MSRVSKNWLSRVVVVMLMCITMQLAALAQSTTDGAIGGTVTDASHAVVPSAKITIVNNGTNEQKSLVTDNEGKFRVVRLQPGTYTVTVEASSFAGLKRQGVIVEVGRVTELEIALTAGAKSETVEVVSEAPQINTVQQDFAHNINETSINELPINGRRWSNFALLTPGATPDGNYGLISFRGISGLLNNSTIDGGDNNQAFFSEERGRTRASYVISQASIREFQVNTSNFSAEYGRAAGGVVNSVTKSGTNQLHGSAFYYIRDNELGATNPFTKITTLVNGAAVTTPLKPEDRRHQFGGTLGGPIVKDKLFFFFSYDQQKRNYPGVAATADPAFLNPITVATAVSAGKVCPGAAGTATTVAGEILFCRGITQTQTNAGLAYVRGLTGVVPRKGDQNIYFPKLDWRINESNTLAVSYNRMRWNSPAGVQSQPVLNRGIASWGDDGVKVDSFTARLSSAVTNTVSNEFRFQWGRDFEFQSSQPVGPGEPTTGVGGSSPSVNISTSSGIYLGKPNFLERRAYPDERRLQWANSTTWAIGKHLVKFGADVNRVNDVLDNLYQESGVYAYNSLVDFLTDYSAPSQKRYNTFSQGFGPTRFEFRTWDYNFFVQDDWRVAPRLTLNLGVRYEYQQLPDPQIPNPALPQSAKFPSDKNNVGPRVGFAWDIFGDGKTALRGGYGVYFGRIINSTISNAITNTGMPTGQMQVQWKGTDAGSPVYPNVQTSGSSSGRSDVVVFGDSMQNPRIQQADMIFERDLGSNTVMTLSWMYSKGDFLPMYVDRNLSAPTATQAYTVNGGPLAGQTVTVPVFKGVRPNAAFGRITNIEGLVDSDYNALSVQLNRRFSKGLQFQNNFTWAHAIDAGQSSQTFTTGNSVLNPYDLKGERGSSNFDIRRRFVSSIVWSPQYFENKGAFVKAVLNGWTIAPVVSISTGKPFTPFVSGNAPGSTSTGLLGAGGAARIPVLGRNNFHYPRTENVDLRLSRRFQIKEGHRIELLAEAFNLFNRQNITELDDKAYSLNGTTLNYNSGFMKYTAAGNTVYRERQVQFAARYEF
ncbi:MAG TPA: TonB-dependent receptor [Clostridia bacterium]|nr:TonB-dependent receptor [Clostridia bacterium]